MFFAEEIGGSFRINADGFTLAREDDDVASVRIGDVHHSNDRSSKAELRDIQLVVCSGVDADEFKRRLPPVQISILEKPVDSEALLELIRAQE